MPFGYGVNLEPAKAATDGVEAAAGHESPSVFFEVKRVVIIKGVVITC